MFKTSLSRGFAVDDVGSTASPKYGDNPRKRAKPGFSSEVAEFHPDVTLWHTMKDFRAAVIAKARASGATDDDVEDLEFYQDIEIDPVTKEVIRCPLEEFGFKYVRFGRSANEPRFFCVYRDPFSGEVFQIYTSWKRFDRKKGKYGKPYLFQTGASPIYTNIPCDTVPKKHILTEGKNKADFLASQAYTATSIAGAFGGYTIKDSAGKPCEARLNPVFLERCEAIGKDQTIYLWMDQDSNIETKFKVDKAIATTATLLNAEGFKVRIVSHDEAEGKGVDDAGMSQPEDEREQWVEARIKEALSLEDWNRDRKKIRFLNYLSRVTTNQIPPERTTEGEYLPELPALSPKTLHFIEAGTGAGKTTEIKRIVRGKACGYTVIFAPTNSVGRAIAEDLNIPHISECDKSNPDKIRAFWSRVHNARAVVMCIDSIGALTDCETLMQNLDLVVIDEVNDCMGNISTGGTTRNEQARVLESFANVLKGMIERGGAFIGAEAGICQHTIDLLKTLSGATSVRLFRHNRTEGFAPKTTLYQGALSGYVVRLEAALVGNAENPGKKIFLPVASQAIGEKIHRHLERYSAAIGKPLKIVRVDSKTNHFGAFDKLFGKPNEYLDGSGINLLIASPSIPSGVSFDAEYDYFDEVWGVFSAHHPGMWQQMQARVRADVPRHLFIKPFIQSNSTFERFCSERGVDRFLKSNQEGFVRSFGVDFESLVDFDDSARRLEIGTAVNQFLAVHHTSIGCQKAIAKDWFIRLLQSSGHQEVTEVKTVKVQEIQDSFARITEELEREKSSIIADLEEDPNRDGFGDGIVAARLRSPEMRTRYYVQKAGSDDDKTYCPIWIRNLLPFKQEATGEAPGIDYDDPEICYKHLCHEGGRQQRGAYLQAMSEYLDSTKSLEKSEVEKVLKGRIVLAHKLPGKWMRAKLIEICGISTLLNGETYSNEDLRANTIKQTALKWSREIGNWLNLTINKSQTPVEICNKLLRKLGLDAEETSRPGSTGNRPRTYKIQGLSDDRNDLLEAMRRKLRGFDEDSVQDSLQMLRGAGNEPDTLRIIWETVQALPECDRKEIWARLSEGERQAILGLEEAIAA